MWGTQYHSSTEKYSWQHFISYILFFIFKAVFPMAWRFQYILPKILCLITIQLKDRCQQQSFDTEVI